MGPGMMMPGMQPGMMGMGPGMMGMRPGMFNEPPLEKLKTGENAWRPPVKVDPEVRSLLCSVFQVYGCCVFLFKPASWLKSLGSFSVSGACFVCFFNW